MSLQSRKAELEHLLLNHAGLWRPQPFKDPKPAWCEVYPALAAEALSVPEAALEARAADTPGLIRWLARHLPELAALLPLTSLPVAPHHTLPAVAPHVHSHVPWRKQAQIEAFAAAIGAPRAPVLEWCAGLGHLGRRLAATWQRPVLSLEIDPALCVRGAALSRGHDQHFLQADALDPASARYLEDRHAVALHACGDLHRRLVIAAGEQRCPALDLAPCCYYRTTLPVYRPLTGGALCLNHDDLRLAVTDTATATPRQRQRSRRAMAWKLAFQVLAGELTGRPYHPLKPVPEAWLAAGFEAWCRRLAAREGLHLPAAVAWPALEAEGYARAGRVRRLELVRLAFRRALEVWLVADLALHLEHLGYRVWLSSFCPESVTPRNLLLSARLA